MAETSLKSQIEQYCKNPHLRNLFLLLYETSSGHDHDGTNSKAVSVGTVSDSSVTNAKLATDVKIGSLATLTTTAKTSVVAAINELDGEIGVLSSLTSRVTTSVVNAINSLVTDRGDITTLTTTEKSNLVGAINEVNAANALMVTLAGAQTLTNKILSSPKFLTPLLDDGDAGVTITSADQTHASPVVTIPDIADAADTFCMIDTAQTLTLKTLTTPIIASLYQDAGKTKLMTIPNVASDTLAVLAAEQTFTNKTITTPVIASIYQDAGKTKLMTLPDVASDTLAVLAGEQTFTNKTLTTPIIASIYQDAGKTKLMTIPDTANDTLCAIAATQTLTNKTLTAPAITSPNLTFSASTHDFSGAHADWTLSASELKSFILTPTNADQAVNIIAPLTDGKMYCVVNGSGFNVVIAGSSGSSVTIANTKTAIVRCDGVNYYRVTADA
ncbi:MAG: hypothetical protein EHM20_00055 [Alphaproteobacteria bacterium]|nr:MAG: hypothetical protein EHM20_00055 [Alphaproteobacteria bacterium]